jgi:hypothetical protein
MLTGAKPVAREVVAATVGVMRARDLLVRARQLSSERSERGRQRDGRGRPG